MSGDLLPEAAQAVPQALCQLGLWHLRELAQYGLVTKTLCKGPRAAPEIGGKDQGVASANNNLALRERGVGEMGNGKLALGTALASPALHFHNCVPSLDDAMASTGQEGD